jgi:adenylosuccinate lyase
MLKKPSRFLLRLVASFMCIDSFAGADYLFINQMATCSSFYSNMRDISENKALAGGFEAAEKRVFARMEKEMGRETAIQMTRASWGTWRLLIGHLAVAEWNKVRQTLNEQCRRYE